MDLVADAASVSFSPSFPLQPLAACPVLSDVFDPLEADDLSDAPVLTTERRLRRLAIVAADTGARFTRERIGHDPVAWLLAPRALFDGRRALDACQGRTGFLRAAVLNALSLGLDADPVEIDQLGGCEGCDPAVAREQGGTFSGPRFFTCSLHELDCLAGGAVVWLMPAPDEKAARERLAEQYGAAAWRAVVKELVGSSPAPECDDFLSRLMIVLLGAAGDAVAGVEFRLEIGRFA